MVRRSPLFAAIVVAGASIGVACGDYASPPVSADAGAEGGEDAVEAGTSTPAGDAGDAGEEDPEAPRKDAGRCPPGSDRPVPPCNLIK